jgi:hypothetical protein
MSSPETIDLLNRMHTILYRSLPIYASYARPWSDATREESLHTLDRIVEHQKKMCDRLCTMVLELGGAIEYGHFPMSFTALHDVSFDHIVKIMLERQHKEVVAFSRIADALRLAPVAQALALEAVGESKAHLDMLQELKAVPAGI